MNILRNVGQKPAIEVFSCERDSTSLRLLRGTVTPYSPQALQASLLSSEASAGSHSHLTNLSNGDVDVHKVSYQDEGGYYVICLDATKSKIPIPSPRSKCSPSIPPRLPGQLGLEMRSPPYYIPIFEPPVYMPSMLQTCPRRAQTCPSPPSPARRLHHPGPASL